MNYKLPSLLAKLFITDSIAPKVNKMKSLKTETFNRLKLRTALRTAIFVIMTLCLSCAFAMVITFLYSKGTKSNTIKLPLV